MQTTATNSASPSAGVLRAWVPLGLATLSASTQAGVYYSNFPDLVIGPDPDPNTFDGFSVSGNVLFNFAVPSITVASGPGGLGRTRFTAFDNVQKKGKSFRSERNFIGNGFVSLNLLTAGTLIDASLPGPSAFLWLTVCPMSSPGSASKPVPVPDRIDMAGSGFPRDPRPAVPSRRSRSP